MKKRSVLLVFFFFMLMQGKAQVFSKVLYDSLAEGSLTGCFIDADGGYVFEGFFSPPSDYDYFIMKTTTTGQPVWMKRSLSNSGPFLKSGIKTHDGGFAFVGEGTEPYYITTVAFVKTDSLGMEQAVRDYWIDEYTASQGKQLLQDASGNFYLLNVGGITDDCYSIIKLDSLGNFLTQKSYCGYLSSGEPCSFIRTADGGFIIVGTAIYGFTSPMFLMKTDSLLNVQWFKLFGNEASWIQYFVQQKINGNYLIVGTHISLSTTINCVLAEITDSGSVIWSKTYESTGRNFYPSGFAQNADGTITVGGYLNGPGARVIIMNVDSLGNLNWSKLLLTSADDEYCKDFKATPDGGFIFCGARIENGKGYPQLTKTDFDGNSPCGDSAFSLVVSDVSFAPQSDSIGEVTTVFVPHDTWSYPQMNYDSLSDLCIATGIHEAKTIESITLFPDPASDVITIVFPDHPDFKGDVSIFNATGKLVRRFTNVHSARLEIPVAEIGSDGLYFCRVMSNDRQIFSGKFLIQR